MRGVRPALVALLVATACAPASPRPPEGLTGTERPAVACAELDEDLCRSVTDAAELMTGTVPIAVQALPIPSDGGTPILERYVVTLAGDADAGGNATQFVEVVRLEGSDGDWSVRRLESMPAD